MIRRFEAMMFAPGRALLALCLLALLGGAACSDSASSPAPAVVVSEAWVQVAGGIDEPAAGYFTIDNQGNSADVLLSASSPAASSVELHETMPGMSGMVGMESVAQVVCPAGTTVTFAPGGYHLMISGLRAALHAGDSLELDLVFEHAGRITVQAAVRQV